jgi:hypothetical protein
LRNPRRERRPRVKRLSMLLHHGSGYRIEDGYVEIIGGVKLKIIGWDRGMPIPRIERLVYRGRRKMLWISKERSPAQAIPA